MKKHLFSILFLTLLSGKALASGCQGGDWQVVSNENLPPAQILTDYYGEIVTEAKVYSSTGYVTLKKIGTETEQIEFSANFDTKEIDLVAALKALHSLPDSVSATVQQTIETNPYYDDCGDIPENTKKTATTYTFSVKVGNKDLVFDGSTITYDPPLKP